MYEPEVRHCEKCGDEDPTTEPCGIGEIPYMICEECYREWLFLVPQSTIYQDMVKTKSELMSLRLLLSVPDTVINRVNTAKKYSELRTKLVELRVRMNRFGLVWVRNEATPPDAQQVPG